MSTEAQMVLEAIKALPPLEFQAVWQQVSRMAVESGGPASPRARVSDEEFEAALDEVTGCTVGRSSLQRLLDDRRRDRELDEAQLEARRRGRASMPDSFLLDTSAFITLADKEPGFERAQSLLKAGKRGEIELHASFVTLTEARYILTYDRGAEKAARISAALRKFPVQWHHSDDALCDEAAKLKAAHKISFADAFVAATAQRLDATLVHKDPEFDALDGVIKLHGLPPKAGKAT